MRRALDWVSATWRSSGRLGRPLMLLALLLLVACPCSVLLSGPGSVTPTPTAEPTVVAAAHTKTSATSGMPTLAPTGVPTETSTPAPLPTSTVPSATLPERVMYFCGYDRCQDSGEYGQLVFSTGIAIWENPDPDRGSSLRQVNNRDPAVVVTEKRVDEGPGGLWFELKDGGWISALWLTEGKCSIYNLPELSFESCLGGGPTAVVPPVAPLLLAATLTVAPTATRIPTFTLPPPTEAATLTPVPTATNTRAPTRKPTASPTSTKTPEPCLYIGNSATKVFHFRGCHHVRQMLESNKVCFESSSAARAAGYMPCGTCNP